MYRLTVYGFAPHGVRIIRNYLVFEVSSGIFVREFKRLACLAFDHGIFAVFLIGNIPVNLRKSFFISVSVDKVIVCADFTSGCHYTAYNIRLNRYGRLMPPIICRSSHLIERNLLKFGRRCLYGSQAFIRKCKVFSVVLEQRFCGINICLCIIVMACSAIRNISKFCCAYRQVIMSNIVDFLR